MVRVFRRQEYEKLLGTDTLRKHITTRTPYSRGNLRRGPTVSCVPVHKKDVPAPAPTDEFEGLKGLRFVDYSQDGTPTVPTTFYNREPTLCRLSV